MVKRKDVAGAQRGGTNVGIKSARLIDISEAAKLMEEEYPGRVQFKITVDCSSQQNCKIVKEHMKSKHFDITPEKSSILGDHSGTKRFATYSQAFKAMMALYNKYGGGKSPKINNAYLGIEVI